MVARAQLEQQRRAVELAARAFREGLRPDPLLTVDEWAGRHRSLNAESSPEPGRWRNDRTPYLVEIMQALSPDHPAREVVFMKGSQIGGTEVGLNWLGYLMDTQAGPILFVTPTDSLLGFNSRVRIDPMIENTPRLKAKVAVKKSRTAGNTTDEKHYPGGILRLVSAGSATNLRSMPVKYLFLDEIDNMPINVDGEGDPVALAEVRHRNFRSSGKVFKCSSPTQTDGSRIEQAYEASDKRVYEVPCPLCGHYQQLVWAQVKWEERDPDTVQYECIACRQRFEERHKADILPAGRWRATNPDADPEIVGFHLSALYSPLGWFSWKDCVRQFLIAKDKGPTLFQVFFNTVLGESWRETGDAPPWEPLYNRREAYTIGTVPRGGVVLVAGTDVQADRIEYEIVAYGRRLESWSVEYRVLEGNTSEEPVWKELEKLLSQFWTREDGMRLSLMRLGLDTGYDTMRCYAWCRKMGRRVLALDGRDRGPIIDQPRMVDITSRGKKLPRGVRLWPVGTDLAKRELYGFLRNEKPVDAETAGYPPGYCHFPEYGQGYFKGLTAEERVPKMVRGYRRLVWHAKGRNEPIDCRVYARAAVAQLAVDRWEDERWDQVERSGSLDTGEEVGQPETRPEAPPARNRGLPPPDDGGGRGWLWRNRRT